MTKEETRIAAKVMEAYADGKKIEYLTGNHEWVDCPTPIFNWNANKYRVKLESKYRPFKTQKECWNEMHNHPDFGWIMKKDNSELTLIYGIYESMGKIWVKFSNDSFHDLDVTKIFNTYTFADGEPFGIKEK